jgi:hypothetical protein
VQQKWCNTCFELKSLEDFYRSAGMRDGHRNDCKSCNLAAKQARYDADPAKAIERVRVWQKANRDRVNESNRRLNSTPERKRKQRDSYYRRTFGMSADEFDAMLEAQGGVCALCGERPEREASLHVDHCHETGAVRGILCLSCNQGLGKFRESAELLERAAAYLRSTRAAG